MLFGREKRLFADLTASIIIIKKRTEVKVKIIAKHIFELNKAYSSELIGYSQHTAGVIRPPRVYNWKSLPEIM